MVTREAIINELRNKGLEVTPVDCVKNGVEMQGITFGTGNVRPTIYVNQFYNTELDLEEVVEKILHQYNQTKNINIDINVDALQDWEYVKDKLILCLQRKGIEDIVKRDYLDLEEYVRVIIGSGTFKVRPEYLVKFGITKDELFDAAWECTRSIVVVENMSQILGIKFTENPMIVASTEIKNHGAIAMRATEKLAEIADRYEKDLAILPSSVHECILLPVDENTDFSFFNAMVREVNATQVAPDEVLSNHAYKFNRNERTITF